MKTYKYDVKRTVCVTSLKWSVNITQLVIADLTYCDAFATFSTRALAVVDVRVVVVTMVTVTMFVG